MMSFNLWTERWVPVLFENGDRREVGLRELLQRAHEMVEIDDPLPTVCYGLYRMLVALVMDIHQFEELDQLADALEKGRFEAENLGTYEDEFGKLFDLFDEKRPFFQTALPADHSEKLKPVAALFQHVPSGTGATHFAHGNADEHAWSPQVCARALTTIAPFMTAGGAGYSPSINGAPPWYLLLKGKNLFETLLLNCWGEPSDGVYGELGKPAWREEKPVEPKVERHSYTLLEGLTWQPRIVQLQPGSGGICTSSGEPSEILVRDMYFTFGWKVGSPDNWTDPHVAYVVDEKRGRLKVMPREGRDPWRHFSAFTLAERRPKTLAQLEQLQDELPTLEDVRLECLGMRTDNAKIFEWRRETLRLSKGVFRHPEAEMMVEQGLEYVDEYGGLLRNCLKTAFEHHRPDALNLFYESLRTPFLSDYLGRLSESREASELQQLRFDWRDRVKRESTAVFKAELDKLGLRGEVLVKRLADAKMKYYGTLKKWMGD